MTNSGMESSEKPTLIEAWTDGASTGRVGPGGWAYVMVVTVPESSKKLRVEDSGGGAKTTNQRMEMIGAIMALKQAGSGDQVRIYSDSAYLINGMSQQWWKKWKENNWRNSRGVAVANADLWKMLVNLEMVPMSVEWIKVKGHLKLPKTESDGNNARADKLAVAAKHRTIKEASKK